VGNLTTGLANDCLVVTDGCKGQLKLPGLWEIPMYAIFENNDPSKVSLPFFLYFPSRATSGLVLISHLIPIRFT